MLNKLKLFTRVASLSLLLTPVKAWSEWRVPERVEIVLGTETLASERQGSFGSLRRKLEQRVQSAERLLFDRKCLHSSPNFQRRMT